MRVTAKEIIVDAYQWLTNSEKISKTERHPDPDHKGRDYIIVDNLSRTADIKITSIERRLRARLAMVEKQKTAPKPAPKIEIPLVRELLTYIEQITPIISSNPLEVLSDGYI